MARIIQQIFLQACAHVTTANLGQREGVTASTRGACSDPNHWL
jgi:hypothetical protein